MRRVNSLVSMGFCLYYLFCPNLTYSALYDSYKNISCEDIKYEINVLRIVKEKMIRERDALNEGSSNLHKDYIKSLENRIKNFELRSKDCK